MVLFYVPDKAVDHPLLDKVIFLPEKRRKKCCKIWLQLSPRTMYSMYIVHVLYLDYLLR